MTSFETVLKKYLVIFSDQEMSFVSDDRNLEYFAAHKSNKTPQDIQLKISTISNDLEIKQLPNTDLLVNHILALSIDDRLAKGDLTLVEDIAHLKINGTDHHLLHFASLYCTLHRPNVYPIYSEQHIEFYKRYITENKLALDPEKINTYDVFSKALNDLVQRLGLTGKMNYLQLRKFGWLYAEKVVQEAKDEKK